MNPPAPNPESSLNEAERPRFRLAMLLPGILVAATGVGSGDLLTAGFAGSKLGLAILWAALYGAILKWVLNEGLARWQMATGTTLLEGWVQKLGRWIRWVFGAYLLLWSFFTGAAMMTGCGVAGHGLMPLHEPEPVVARKGESEASLSERADTARRDAARRDKIVWGIVHSLAGLLLVWFGGFKVFEIAMAVCIAVMFGTVLLTAVLAKPNPSAVLQGTLVPRIPSGAGADFSTSLGWVLGVLGGVGGTATLLCYGYWIREERREGAAGVRACRLDLGVGYLLTALFGMAMISLGSGLKLDGQGDDYAPILAGRLSEVMGPWGRWIFLLGFWGAVFSSLLGVWQGVPYLFADFVLLCRGRSAAQEKIDLAKTREYKFYLVALALLPMVLLWLPVKRIQLLYAIFGAFFMPLLALTLLILNNRRDWVGDRFKSGWIINLMLGLTLLFFGALGAQEAVKAFQKLLN